MPKQLADMRTLELVRWNQKQNEQLLSTILPGHELKAPEHKPDMLYIGCIDARLDPIDDLKIPAGKALIHRTIGALVAGLKDGEALNASEAASIDFAVNVMHVKDIVIAAHTHCGGLGTCIHGINENDHETPFLKKYLKQLKDVLSSLAGIRDTEQKIHELEDSSVRNSLKNLLSYPFVKKAVEEGKLQLHGWVLDTATKRILEVDPVDLKFKPMAHIPEDHADHSATFLTSLFRGINPGIV